jgi:hypothetical protein
VICDPSRPRTTVSLGIFTGRLVAVHPEGDGEIQGYCGPQRVVLPAALMNGTRLGADIRYYATAMPNGTAVAARLLS